MPLKTDKLPQFTGALPDIRDDAQKSKDWKHSEVVASAPLVQWREKTFDELLKFPERFQDYSSSCMAQSGVKNLGVANYAISKDFPILSALMVYRSRVNYPAGGMGLADLFTLLTKGLACLETDKKSQRLTEIDMNNAVIKFSNTELVDAVKFKADGYFYLDAPYKIDDFAAILAQEKSIEAMLFFEADEYWKPIPEVLREVNLYAPTTSRHGIAILDFLLINGKKFLYIEDSSGNWTGINGQGRRYISEEFLAKRCFGAGYLVKKSYSVPTRPRYSFTKILTYGMKNEKDVAALQSILQYEGFMPSQIDGVNFAPTGNFFGMTAQALKKWQVAHAMNDFANENDMTKIRFGKKSMVFANALYGII